MDVDSWCEFDTYKYLIHKQIPFLFAFQYTLALMHATRAVSVMLARKLDVRVSCVNVLGSVHRAWNYYPFIYLYYQCRLRRRSLLF